MLQDAHPSRILRKHLDAAAQVHTVDTLQTRGVRQVRVLSESRMRDIARIAVYRAVQSFLGEFDLDPETQREIEARAEEEYQSLLVFGLDAEAVVPAAESPASDALDEVLAREQKRLSGLVNDGVSSPARPDVGSRSDQEPFDLETQMADDITRLVELDWKKELAQVESSHREQLAALEARIGKLVSALEATDRVLEHMQHQTSSGQTAVAAPKRVMSGPLVKKKSQLLDALFQANVQLQELENGQ